MQSPNSRGTLIHISIEFWVFYVKCICLREIFFFLSQFIEYFYFYPRWLLNFSKCIFTIIETNTILNFGIFMTRLYSLTLSLLWFNQPDFFLFPVRFESCSQINFEEWKLMFSTLPFELTRNIEIYHLNTGWTSFWDLITLRRLEVQASKLSFPSLWNHVYYQWSTGTFSLTVHYLQRLQCTLATSFLTVYQKDT